jgi:tRNA(Ile)-lysidine synthase
MAFYAPRPDLLDRFRASLTALGGAPMPLGIAFSGGPDSLALLLLAAGAFPGRVEAATVDHGLRPGSADEAAQASAVCAAIGVPHATLKVSVPPGASTQAQARAARYEALGIWSSERGISCLLTAHHLDDQAETVLMRLLRGSGVAGLAGIRARRPLASGSQAETLRPLLGWRRTELVEIAAASGLAVAADPSNRDEAYDRVRIRRLLAESAWLDPAALARSASALADAEDALEAVTAVHFASAVIQGENGLLFQPGDLHVELRRRILLRCIRRFVPDAAPRGEEISNLLSALEQGRAATLAGVMVKPAGTAWRIAPAPPRRLARGGQAV